MLRISWMDRVNNVDILEKITKKMLFWNNIIRRQNVQMSILYYIYDTKDF